MGRRVDKNNRNVIQKKKKVKIEKTKLITTRVSSYNRF